MALQNIERTPPKPAEPLSKENKLKLMASAIGIILFIVFLTGETYHEFRFPYLAKSDSARVVECQAIRRYYNKNSSRTYIAYYSLTIEHPYQLIFSTKQENQLDREYDCKKYIGRKIPILYSDELSRAVWNNYPRSYLELLFGINPGFSILIIPIILVAVLLAGALVSLSMILIEIAQITDAYSTTPRRWVHLTESITNIAITFAVPTVVVAFGIYLFKGVAVVELNGSFVLGSYLMLTLVSLSFGPGLAVRFVHSVRRRHSFLKILGHIVFIFSLIIATYQLVFLTLQLSPESSPELIKSFFTALWEFVKEIFDL